MLSAEHTSPHTATPPKCYNLNYIIMSKIRNFTDEINQAKHLLNWSLYCGSTQLELLYFVDLYLSKLRENKIVNINICLRSRPVDPDVVC